VEVRSNGKSQTKTNFPGGKKRKYCSSHPPKNRKANKLITRHVDKLLFRTPRNSPCFKPKTAATDQARLGRRLDRWDKALRSCGSGKPYSATITLVAGEKLGYFFKKPKVSKGGKGPYRRLPHGNATNPPHYQTTATESRLPSRECNRSEKHGWHAGVFQKKKKQKRKTIVKEFGKENWGTEGVFWGCARSMKGLTAEPPVRHPAP